MRCISPIPSTITTTCLRWWQLLLSSGAVCVSLAAHTTTVASAAYATHLMQTDLKIHLINKALIKTIRQHASDTIKTWQQQLRQRLLAITTEDQSPPYQRLTPYPLHAVRLTPGKATLQVVSTALPQPIFIIGDDSASKKWLRRYQVQLIKQHAQGFVVNVASQAAMQSLQQQFPQLALMPMPGDALAAWLKLKYYPVLMVNAQFRR